VLEAAVTPPTIFLGNFPNDKRKDPRGNTKKCRLPSRSLSCDVPMLEQLNVTLIMLSFIIAILRSLDAIWQREIIVKTDFVLRLLLFFLDAIYIVSS
jgi:hypothetical protein